jgi:hypothetical protein
MCACLQAAAGAAADPERGAAHTLRDRPEGATGGCSCAARRAQTDGGDRGEPSGLPACACLPASQPACCKPEGHSRGEGNGRAARCFCYFHEEQGLHQVARGQITNSTANACSLSACLPAERAHHWRQLCSGPAQRHLAAGGGAGRWRAWQQPQQYSLVLRFGRQLGSKPHGRCSTHNAGSLHVTCLCFHPSLSFPVQADVSDLLLKEMVQLCSAEGEEAALPQLILGQFRWWVRRRTLCARPPAALQKPLLCC